MRLDSMVTEGWKMLNAISLYPEMRFDNGITDFV